MKLKVEGLPEINGKLDVIILLHASQGILHDLLEGLVRRTITFPEDRDKSPDQEIRDAREILNRVIDDFLSCRAEVE